MSECLKLLNDLAQMAEPMNVSILRHLFAQYDPSASRALRETILHFHMRELEASDYRSAYHQFSDWLYGWNVSDAAEYADVRGSIAEYLKSRRIPRDIDIKHDRERSESLRLMKTFETLCSLSRRHLKKFYMDIEAEMPRLGQGLETMSTNTNRKNRKDMDGGDEGGSLGDGNGDNKQDDAMDEDVERVWAAPGGGTGGRVSDTGNDRTGVKDAADGLRDIAEEDGNALEGVEEADEEEEDDEDDDEDDDKGRGAGRSRNGRGASHGGDDGEGDDLEGSGPRQAASRGGTRVRRRSKVGSRGNSQGGGGATGSGEFDNEGTGSGKVFEKGDGKGGEDGNGGDSRNSSRSSSASDREQEVETLTSKALTGGNGQQGFNFMSAPPTAPAAAAAGGAAGGAAAGGSSVQAGTMVEASAFGLADNMDDARRALQRDVNHVFAEVDRCTEYTLVCMSSALVVLTFAELLEDKETYTKFCNLAHELSMDFVSNTLKTVWDLLNKEIPSEISLATLRDPYALRDVLKRLLELRAVNGRVPKYRMRKLFFKFETVHDIFRATDIHIFPNFVAAHREGAKCAKFSAFDSSLWLTGGYDCVIRISDIRNANNHICLAQYVGHKSIVTDVHFTKNDSQIVSSSFDRTIKIWNSQQATVERTLVGHTDAVTSCDVSADGRFIASGSTDCTVRFWDFATGECITVIRKHTRWVKVVRFSPDGRHLATAGLDRRIYIWDTKILANSRSPTHSRCIDTFGDYVLDMAMYRPSLLLTTARDSTVRLFDYMTGHELHTYNLSPSWACSVCFSDNGEYFATGSFDNNVVVFRTRDFVKVREIRVFNLGIMCVRFPKDLSYVIVGTTEGFVQQIPL